MGRYSGKTCRLIFMLVMTVIFFVAEIVAGYMGNSIALVSDSFNMLSDIISLCVGLTAARVSRQAGSGRCTYGLSRAEVVGALANTVFLAALCFSISVEALKRLARPEAIDDPELVLIVGALGLAVNLVGLLIFQDCRNLCWMRGGGASKRPQLQSNEKRSMNDETGASIEEDGPKNEGQPLNIRGVLLHVLNDALGSVVVVVASTIFYLRPLGPEAPCNWQCYIDPSLTLLMVVIIMSSAMPLVKETAGILLQMSPQDLQLDATLENLSRIPGVHSIHEVHVWELAKGRNVATLHVRCSSDSRSLHSEVLHWKIQEVLHQVGVHSVTCQLEYGESVGEDEPCSFPCVSLSCQKLRCCVSGPPSRQPVWNGHAPTPTGQVMVDIVDTPQDRGVFLGERETEGEAVRRMKSTKL
ncbi:calcium/manganese antiporter SLC30A10 [Chanos chanos]|uniref:Calcium/manganese antiporter SLC30A10 n=1 Tax=Chanos chanos TaxID=29144 RepID=A0A6J2V6Z2_CHACN|nr:zinc transporter 10 [Chanos chanos]